MKKQEKNQKTQVLTEREWYREKISEMISKIDQTWILMEIVRFIKNITK